MNPIADLLTDIEEQELWDEIIVLKRNEFLTQTGQINTNIYYVEEGSLRIFWSEETEEHTIRFGYENSIFGALDSFFSGGTTSYSIQALKNTTLRMISRNTLEKWVRNSPENQDSWRLILEGIVQQQLEIELDLLTSSPSERYRRVMKRSPQLFQEIPNKYIASYLRMTPETLSRVKKY